MKNNFFLYVMIKSWWGVLLILTCNLTSQAQEKLPTGEFFELRNFTSKMAISNRSQTFNGAKLHQLQKVGKDGHWEFIRKDSYYQIRNKANGFYIANFQQKNHAAEMKQTNTPGDGALWRPIKLSNGYYQFKNKFNGMFLANGGVKKEGTPIYQVKNPGEGSYWMLRKAASVHSTAQLKPTGTDQQNKFQKTLKKIKQAQSIGEFRQIMEATSFSKKELVKFMKGLKKEPYASHLKKLGKKEPRTYSLTDEPPKGPQLATMKKYQEKLNLEYKNWVTKRNTKARQMAKNYRPNLNVLEKWKNQPIAETPTLPAERLTLSEPVAARINRIAPAVLEPGKQATIYGHDFTSETGRVALKMEGQLFFAEIIDWQDHSIEIKIPLELMEILKGYSKTTTVWVKMPGREVGPTLVIQLAPNFDYLKPRIDFISSNRITPGQEITLVGENLKFGPGEGDWMTTRTNPTLKIDLTNLCILDHENEDGFRYWHARNRDLTLEEKRALMPDGIDAFTEEHFKHEFLLEYLEYQDGIIHAKLPQNISGFKAGAVDLVVTNYHGQETRYRLQYEPRMYLCALKRRFILKNDWLGIGWLGGDPGIPTPGIITLEHPESTVWTNHTDNIRSHSSSWWVNGTAQGLPMEWWYAPEHFEIQDILFKYENGNFVESEVTYKTVESRRIKYNFRMKAWNGWNNEATVILYLAGPYCYGSRSRGVDMHCHHISNDCPPFIDKAHVYCKQKDSPY